jgi:hypothetical protein
MNGIRNAMFIIIMMMFLVAVDYVYTIGDQLTNQINAHILSNPITTAAFISYGATRNLIYSAVTGVMVPFLIFLSFTSSFINRNQTVVTYMIQAISVMLITPLLIFLFAQVFTNLLAVSILDTQYMATTYFNNFLYIMVTNMLLALASFVFVQKGAVEV